MDIDFLFFRHIFRVEQSELYRHTIGEFGASIIKKEKKRNDRPGVQQGSPR